MNDDPATNAARPLRIMVSAGEISGDMYAAAIVRELRRLAAPRVLEVFGLGGDRLREEGAELFEHASRTGVIGIWEVLKRARFFSRLLRTMKAALAERRPDLLLTVDYPGMNLRLAAEAKKLGIPAVHYVCPQVWAWHRGRIPKIAASLDRLIALFPFEPALFAGTGLDVRFAGHPLVDAVAASLREEADAPPLPWAPGARRIALFAGSRRNEVRRILPDVLAGAAMAEEALGPCSFLLPVPTAERAADG
ncbi:MAG: lipid-A-disaccharide synthase, partial [Kiritimatiellae bacterium]|nr:lipid-A-disaccharide synthase [Kiritimatiellia bacterium]